MQDKQITEAIDSINSNIKELNQHKAFLESLNDSTVLNEEEWHLICETDLRTSDILKTYVTNIWPDAHDITVGSNYVKFTLYDFLCYLPTSRITGIEIDTKWFYRMSKPKMEYHMKSNYRLLRLKRFVESDNWKDKAKNIIGRDIHPIVRAIRWLTVEQFKQDEYIEEYNRRLAENNESFEKQLELYNKKIEEDKKRINILRDKLIPELSKFSSNIKVYNDNRYLLTIDYIIHYFDEDGGYNE